MTPSNWLAKRLLALAVAVPTILAGCASGGGSTGGGGNPTVPAAPAGVVATAGNTQVSLTWTASSGATSYHVKRGTASGGPYTQVGAPTAASDTDTGLTNGTTYYYVVTALNTAGESGNSSEANAKPVAPTQIPAAPAGVVATPGNAQVSLTWTASSGSEQLSREARDSEWWAVHASRRANGSKLYGHGPHQRDNVLLRCVRAEYSG